MLEADDILTVDASNYLEKLGTPATIEAALGRLVQFKGIKVRYAGVKNQDGVTNPALKSGSYDNIYPSWLCTDVRPTVSQPWYYWAYSVDNDKLYGSVLITYAAAPTITSERGVYSVVSSRSMRSRATSPVRPTTTASIRLRSAATRTSDSPICSIPPGSRPIRRPSPTIRP